MKSRLTKTIDYRRIPVPEKLICKAYPAEAIRRRVLSRCERAAQLKEISSEAMPGDIVILRKGEEMLHVNLGKAMHPQLEQACLKRKKGEVLPESGYEVAAVVRKTIPELSDEIMKILEPEESITAEDYYRQLAQEEEDKILYKTASAVFNIIMNQAVHLGEPLFDAGELCRYEEDIYARYAEYGEAKGLSAEEAIAQFIPEKQQSDPAAYLKELAQKEVAKAAACCFFLGTVEEEIPQEEDMIDYVSFVQDSFYEKVADYVKDIMKWEEE